MSHFQRIEIQRSMKECKGKPFTLYLRTVKIRMSSARVTIDSLPLDAVMQIRNMGDMVIIV